MIVYLCSHIREASSFVLNGWFELQCELHASYDESAAVRGSLMKINKRWQGRLLPYAVGCWAMKTALLKDCRLTHA